jgi:hypothetical protein
MEVLEITRGARFPTAVELPVSRARPASKHIARKGGGNSAPKKRGSHIPPASVRQREADQRVTEANARVLRISATGKRTWARG